MSLFSINQIDVIPDIIWFDLTFYEAKKCVNALLKGETHHEVKLDCPNHFGRFSPLHHATLTKKPKLVELFLHHNALVDYRCIVVEGKHPMNPLNSILEDIRYHLIQCSFYIECLHILILGQS